MTAATSNPWAYPEVRALATSAVVWGTPTSRCWTRVAATVDRMASPTDAPI